MRRRRVPRRAGRVGRLVRCRRWWRGGFVGAWGLVLVRDGRRLKSALRACGPRSPLWRTGIGGPMQVTLRQARVMPLPVVGDYTRRARSRPRARGVGRGKAADG